MAAPEGFCGEEYTPGVFDSILGSLTRREPTLVVVRVGGLGYEVRVPLSTYERLPRVGDEVGLLLHLVVREDEWRLYGFLSGEERDVFRALLRVTGIGPGLALSLLSGLTTDEFRAAVAHGDVKVLSRVKGIGRKTAERVVVELRDVVGRAPAAAPVGGSGGTTGGPREDAVRALLALGLDAGDAVQRVDRVLAREGEVPVSDLVRAALRG
jgi:Holliday junction DNA helicase RuvA